MVSQTTTQATSSQRSSRAGSQQVRGSLEAHITSLSAGAAAQAITPDVYLCSNASASATTAT